MLKSLRRNLLIILLPAATVFALVGVARHTDADLMSLRARSVLSPAVQRVLADPARSEVKVWVHFAPRDLSPGDTEDALATAAAALVPRARARRAKMPWPGPWPVDVRDLPLDPERLDACRATGARLVHGSRWLNAASFRAAPAEIRRLARVAGVRAITRVGGMRPTAVPRPVAPPVSLGRRSARAGKADTAIDYGANLAAMEQANVLPAHDMGLSGRGVVVGMLDTGFRTTHEALAGIAVLATWDFVNDDPIVDTETSDPPSAHNHGTMTLSTLAGNMPGQLVGPGFGVSVLLAKTEDIAVEVPLEEDHWVAGLEWAESRGADIVSSSLGYVDWYDAADLDGNTAVTTIAADLAAARGLVVVTSAGNDRATTGHLIAPGDADSVITVGAVDDTGTTAWFSSPGPAADGRIKPDVAALGVSNAVADPSEPLNYVAASGTSFSCPLTSGVVALMLERAPGLTPMQVREALTVTASQSAAPDNDQGWGIIDAAAAVTWFGPEIAHVPLPETAAGNTSLPVTATITARAGLIPGEAVLRYRVDGGPWTAVSLVPTGQPDEFAAEIPGQPAPAQVDYLLAAVAADGVETRYPFAGEAGALTVFVSASSAAPPGDLPPVSVLDAAVPNPFNPRTTLGFTLAREGRVRLEIFDVRGRLVRTLLDEVRSAGDQAVVWDGRSNAGTVAASGTYLARLVAPDTVRRQKMQLVR